ncbi:hypothetical protein F5B22DRAFT_202208 [Xylaria bambusicola]|uniref:uncharacterized protein n=1 Tax=Xylaria bambusicola TaxID=326684 RepID=UPI002007B8F2|nr:uncharacterized protein F5B22DRAFT_202208 [Xylaria bambusicola]KAI0515102.1 hypothetical protein F5B22DRAFT_202208 [Xylaria bambusicola]
MHEGYIRNSPHRREKLTHVDTQIIYPHCPVHMRSSRPDTCSTATQHTRREEKKESQPAESEQTLCHEDQVIPCLPPSINHQFKPTYIHQTTTTYEHQEGGQRKRGRHVRTAVLPSTSYSAVVAAMCRTKNPIQPLLLASKLRHGRVAQQTAVCMWRRRLFLCVQDTYSMPCGQESSKVRKKRCTTAVGFGRRKRRGDSD